MKLTLDHNVIIDCVNQSANIAHLREQIADGVYKPYVVEVGASEMRDRGIRPDRYDLFEVLLREAGLETAPRLTPIGIFDIFFWDHALWAGEDSVSQANLIDEILFGDAQQVAPDSKARLNRTCDVLSMWCHIHYGNNIFVTSDRNFHKATKLPWLLKLGARRIARPEEL